ncbi:DUF3987 domain-containing protein [Streptomyces sp. NPDC037389]|uniref:DUF3987 domain-containing protein n=1 Tax=Streptomyces sp. NPDC037389 TaxID=3155369 RepID=UPI0033C271F2
MRIIKDTEPMFYGPIGAAVARIAPFAETDPLGIYVAALTLWSAAISGTVRVASRGSTRPVLVWSALVARSGRGKGEALRGAHHVVGQALDRFLHTHTISGITSGASLVNHLWEQQEATSETEQGRDVRSLVLEEEWSEILKRTKRDTSFTTKLRTAWDGATLRNTTKEGPQEVKAPAMVLHAHITPSDWATYVAQSDAAGGSYNRILPFLLAAVPMMDDEVQFPPVEGEALTEAYKWATAKPRVVTLSEDAKPLWRIVRRYARILSETLPEDQAVFIERTAEQTLRVAACLAASERSELITAGRLNAAFNLVRRSVQDAVQIVTRAAKQRAKKQPLSLADKVRARVLMHGGRATSSQVLPYVGATAAEVKALPGIVVEHGKGTGGRPTVILSLDDADDRAPAAEPEPDVKPDPVPAPEPRKATPPTRLRTVPAPAKKPAPVQPARPRPARSENMFFSVL